MGKFFNPVTGLIKKIRATIIQEKATTFSESIGQAVDSSPASGFSMLNDASSIIDEQINQNMGLLWDTVINMINATKKEISTPEAVTHEAIKKNIFKYIPNLRFISFKDGAGEIDYYLIFKDGFLDTSYPYQIWQGLHFLSPSGTKFNGTTTLSYADSQGQIVSYKYSLGIKKYVYIVVKYLADDLNYILSNVDETIIDLYDKIVLLKYSQTAIPLDFQDFVQSTYKIDGISRTDFYYYISSDPNLNVGDLDIDNFGVNINYPTAISDALIFNFSGQYILVNKTNDSVGPGPRAGVFP